MSADPVASDYWRRGGLSRRSEPQVLPAVGAQFRASFVGPAAVKAGGGGRVLPGRGGGGRLGFSPAGHEIKGKEDDHREKYPDRPEQTFPDRVAVFLGIEENPEGRNHRHEKEKELQKASSKRGNKGQGFMGPRATSQDPGIDRWVEKIYSLAPSDP